MIRWKTINLSSEKKDVGNERVRKMVFLQIFEENIYKGMEKSFPPLFSFLNLLSNQTTGHGENCFLVMFSSKRNGALVLVQP